MGTQFKEPTSAEGISKLTGNAAFKAVAKTLKRTHSVKVYVSGNAVREARTVTSRKELLQAVRDQRALSSSQFKSFSIPKKIKK